MISVKVKNLEKFKAQLRGRVGPTLSSKIQTLIRKDLSVELPRLLVSLLQNTVTYKGLNGDYAGDTTGRDLVAEFGLDPIESKQILSEISDYLESAIKVSKSNTDGTILKIEIVEEKFQQIFQIPGSTYQSYATNRATAYEIPWLEWVLAGTAKIAAYRIIYGDFPTSRSTRAIMINEGSGSWSYATKDKPNFIFKVFNSKNFLNQVNKAYDRSLKRHIKEKLLDG